VSDRKFNARSEFWHGKLAATELAFAKIDTKLDIYADQQKF